MYAWVRIVLALTWRPQSRLLYSLLLLLSAVTKLPLVVLNLNDHFFCWHCLGTKKYQILCSRGKKLSQIWNTSFEVLNIQSLLVDLCIPPVRNIKEASKRGKILLAMFSAFNQSLLGKLLEQKIMGKPPVLPMNTRHKHLWKSTASKGNSKTWLGQKMPRNDVCQKLHLRNKYIS